MVLNMFVLFRAEKGTIPFSSATSEHSSRVLSAGAEWVVLSSAHPVNSATECLSPYDLLSTARDNSSAQLHTTKA